MELFGLCVKSKAVNDSRVNTLLQGNAPTVLRSELIGIALVSTVTPIHRHSASSLSRYPGHAGSWLYILSTGQLRNRKRKFRLEQTKISVVRTLLFSEVCPW